MRTIAPSLPACDQVDNPRLVLRDGSVASVRVAEPSDREAIRRFFHELSAESRQKRFFISSEPPASLIDVFGDNRDAAQTLTLLVHRHRDSDVRPVAVASYFALNPQRAEVAFAVDDHFHGKGLATALLERLAVLAANRGFELFEASTLEDNTAMLEVFRDSGFEIRSKSSQGVVALTLSLTPSVDGVHRAEERDRLATSTSLRPLLVPNAVAVIGASRDPASIGRRVFDAVRAAGFPGAIYPVNPGVTELESPGGHRGTARARASHCTAGGGSAGDRRARSQPGDRVVAGERLPHRRCAHPGRRAGRWPGAGAIEAAGRALPDTRRRPRSADHVDAQRTDRIPGDAIGQALRRYFGNDEDAILSASGNIGA